MTRSPLRCRGFTLVEMLVVIAIIGILAAMLIPMLNGVRSRSLRVACLSNIRQVGAAFVSYSTDERNKGYFPHEDRDGLPIGSTMEEGNYCWFDAIDEHLGTENLSRVKQCPAWEGYINVDEKGNTVDEHSFKMNSMLEVGIDESPKGGSSSGSWPADPIAKKYYFYPAHRCQKPSETCLIFDGQTITTAGATKGELKSVEYIRHEGTTNFVFVDGSARGIDGVALGIQREDPPAGWTDEGGIVWDPWK